MRTRRPLPSALLIAFLLVLPLARVALTYRVFAEIVDEPVHVAAGYEWLKNGTYTFDRQHPPLARVLFALPAIHTGLPVTRDPIAVGNSIYYRNEHYVRNLAETRAPNLLFLLLALIGAALWARKLAGDTAALLTLAILGALPPLLGHAGLATTDVPVTAMITLALYFFDEWQLRPTWRNSSITALCIGIGVLSKMSFLTLFTIGALVLIRRWPRITQCAAIALIVVMIVWSGHRFSTGHLNDYRLTTFDHATAEYQAAKYATAPGYGWVRGDIVRRYWRYAYDVGHGRMTGIDFVDWARTAGYPSPSAGRRGDTMRGWPPVPPLHGFAKFREPFLAAFQWIAANVSIPAPEFAAGMECVIKHVYTGHQAYLFGRISEKGWWYYFPVILFFKTPFALLILAIIGLRFMPRYALIPIAMLALAMTTAINIGVRHILPLYPFLAVAASIAILHMKRPMAIALCAWYFIATTLAHPDYMAYFNEFAFGHPERIATDSNLDWGQDLLRLGDYATRHHIDYVDYFGTADWRSHVPGALEMPEDHPVHGWIAVSDMRRDFGGAEGRGIQWLQPYAPVGRIGASIWLYHIP